VPSARSMFKGGPDGTLTDEREEPIAADARPEHDGKDLAKLKVVAGLLGFGLDEIVRRAERARRKRQRHWGAALLLLTVTFAGLAALAEFNRREAERNRVEAEKQRDHAEQETIQARKDLSSALTALAFTELEQRPSNAAKLALAAWPRPGATDLPNREVTLSAVFRSLAGLHERMGISTNSSITSVAFRPRWRARADRIRGQHRPPVGRFDGQGHPRLFRGMKALSIPSPSAPMARAC
jgi:hypothetical protein